MKYYLEIDNIMTELSLKNLEIVKNSLRKLNWNKNEYNLTHDENLIFVEKDLL